MKRTELVGVLNVTPDSFSDGNQFLTADKALHQAQKLFEDGASLVDVGAEATNPFVDPISPQEEWQRLEPILIPLLHEFPGKISLDTYHHQTAEKALSLGPVIINDVTMFRDPKMIDVVARYKARCIISHLSPESSSIADAHKNPRTTTVDQVKNELLAKREELIEAGIPAKNIILDPGIGFGKTMDLNRRLLSFANELPDMDVMIGYSRKRFLGDKRMELGPNLKAGREAVKTEARYLRVHDVAGHYPLVQGV